MEEAGRQSLSPVSPKDGQEGNLRLTSPRSALSSMPQPCKADTHELVCRGSSSVNDVLFAAQGIEEETELLQGYLGLAPMVLKRFMSDGIYLLGT